MLVTLFGMAILVSLEQPENDPSLIFVMLFGILYVPDFPPGH